MCPLQIISCLLISSTQRFLYGSCKLQAHARLTSVRFAAAVLLSHARSLHIHGNRNTPSTPTARSTQIYCRTDFLRHVLMQGFVIPSSVRNLTSVEAWNKFVCLQMYSASRIKWTDKTTYTPCNVCNTVLHYLTRLKWKLKRSEQKKWIYNA